MKRLLSIICGGAIALSLFAAPGSPAKAAEPTGDSTTTASSNDDCSCHDLKPLTGPERNKLVADFLSSQEFKAKKLELLHSGYSWNGAQSIEVIIPAEGVTMIGVPFRDVNGTGQMYVFINGTFAGTSPME